jgi:hypothetical protein
VRGRGRSCGPVSWTCVIDYPKEARLPHAENYIDFRKQRRVSTARLASKPQGSTPRSAHYLRQKIYICVCADHWAVQESLSCGDHA